MFVGCWSVLGLARRPGRRISVNKGTFLCTEDFRTIITSIFCQQSLKEHVA